MPDPVRVYIVLVRPISFPHVFPLYCDHNRHESSLESVLIKFLSQIKVFPENFKCFFGIDHFDELLASVLNLPQSDVSVNKVRSVLSEHDPFIHFVDSYIPLVKLDPVLVQTKQLFIQFLLLRRQSRVIPVIENLRLPLSNMCLHLLTQKLVLSFKVV